LDEFYLLMRETVEPNEPLEHAAHRGLMEEFGATAELVDYAGAIKSRFYDSGIEIEKTTVYFLFKVIDQDTSKRTSSDAEQGSVIEWLPPEFLIPIMKKQTDKHGRTDIDESSILERYIAR
jgi:ADP-ribose pyrophosphatase YjhB (NUDIX family)